MNSNQNDIILGVVVLIFCTMIFLIYKYIPRLRKAISNHLITIITAVIAVTSVILNLYTYLPYFIGLSIFLEYMNYKKKTNKFDS